MLILFSTWSDKFKLEAFHYLISQGCIIIAFGKDLEEIIKLPKQIGEAKVIPIILDLQGNWENYETNQLLSNLPYIEHIVNYDGESFEQIVPKLGGKNYETVNIEGNDLETLWKNINKLGTRGGLFNINNPYLKPTKPNFLHRISQSLSFRQKSRNKISPCSNPHSQLIENLRGLYKSEKLKLDTDIDKRKNQLEEESNYKYKSKYAEMLANQKRRGHSNRAHSCKEYKTEVEKRNQEETKRIEDCMDQFLKGEIDKNKEKMAKEEKQLREELYRRNVGKIIKILVESNL